MPIQQQISIPVVQRGDKIIVTVKLKTPDVVGKAALNWVFIDSTTSLLVDLPPLHCIVNVVEPI